ncbi:uncharacterized protein BX664DRAFT_336121 [Halteromyces radiatus]|uniref:uncharacterized protein n=1 Tax=Halteromyces radiatus TaxID=101107 RepID=UPI002220573B|nr:uncharacterized protein BX664DRAFT_336121 [Halteromyces radiatus]KAI8086546.1 hypothetical protein BX664DRAFT_336121 [Halteromyces radiatus]
MNDNNCFSFLTLTSEDSPMNDDDICKDKKKKKDDGCWLDDSLSQENLTDIMILTPDETTTDNSNHICTTSIRLFFDELGYLTEEPQPIDPTKNYAEEFEARVAQHTYKKTRRRHIDLSRIPSLLDEDPASDMSSTSSSFIHHPTDIEPYPVFR